MFYQAPSSSASPMLAGNRAESTESFYSRYHNQSSSRLVPEQGLQDLSIQIVSPMGMNLYEPDPGDKKRLLSPCSAGFSDTLHSPGNDSPRVLNCFDLNPQCEQSSDIWDILNDIGTREPDSPTGELDDIKPSFTSCELASLQDTPASVILDWNKVFVQEQDKSPTLAQLNDHNSIFMDTNDHLHGTSLSSCGASLGNDPQTKSSVKSTPLCQSATSGVRGQLLGLSQNTPLPFANLPAETGVRLTTCTMTSPPPAVTVAHPPLDAVYTQGSPYVCSFQTPSASGSVASLPSRGIPAGNKTSTMKSELMLNTTCIKPDPDAPPPVSAHSPLYTPTSSQKMFKNPVIGTVAVKSEPLDTPAGREEGSFSGPVKDQRRKRTTSINMLDAGKLALSWQDTAAACSETKRPRGVKTEQVDIAFTPSEEMGPSRDDEAYDSGGDDPDDSGMDSDGMEFSDAESESSHSSFIEEFMGTGRKDKRFFWQYNTQSKGPKGKRLCKTLNPEDPHVLNEFEDPVFDPDQQDTKYKHNGKARRGDGNDITPNPYRLFLIGNELKKLNRQINSIVPVTEAPQTGRNRKRKEKNKYASRACRLKKKAQHEANKLTLYGLDHEHAQLMQVMDLLKEDIIGRIENPASHDGENLCSKLDRYIRKCLTIGMVAGHSADYVNSVLETVASGDKTGGITLVD